MCFVGMDVLRNQAILLNSSSELSASNDSSRFIASGQGGVKGEKTNTLDNEVQP